LHSTQAAVIHILRVPPFPHYQQRVSSRRFDAGGLKSALLDKVAKPWLPYKVAL
jgi:hypothetical protein